MVKEIRSGGGEAVANFESVTDFKAAKRIVDCAIDNFGKLNIIVNNAGILRDRMIFNMSEEDWDAVVSVHLKGSSMSRATRARTGANSTRPAIAQRPAHQYQFRLGHTRQRGPEQLRHRESGGRDDGDYRRSRDEPLRRHRQCDCAGRAHAPDHRCDAADRGGMAQKGGESDTFTPAHVAPLVAWLASDDAKDVHGEVFRVGMGNVWLMQGWHSGAKVPKKGSIWDPAELGTKLKEELAKGVTKKESMGEVMAGGV